jgi:ECF sigma factor
MEREDVTRLVSRLRSGDRTAFGALLGLTYQELQQLARSHLRHERSDHTLKPAALVHEVWMRLSQQRDHSFDIGPTSSAPSHTRCAARGRGNSRSVMSIGHDARLATILRNELVRRGEMSRHLPAVCRRRLPCENART